MGFFAPRISRCSFNLRVNSAAFRLANSYTSSSYVGNIGNCNIKLAYEGVVPDAGNIFGAGVITRDCMLNVTDGNGGVITAEAVGDSIIIGNNFTITNNSTDNMSGTVVYNSDTITTGSLLSTRIKPLTTSQLKDTSGSALRSIGFPI
jgi:hypothetical protein